MTGREVILEAAAGIIESDAARRIAERIETLGYVCVPCEPTKDMINAAYWDALAEDAAEVWRTMVEASEGKLTRGGTVAQKD